MHRRWTRCEVEQEIINGWIYLNMKSLFFITIILITIAVVKLAHHYAWLASPATPYAIDTITPTTGEAHILLGQKININTAPISHLEALPGIGPSIAKRIVAYRKSVIASETRQSSANARKKGITRAFHSHNDIIRVRGIGPAKLLEIRHLIDIE